MMYQLPNGKVIHLSIEEFLDLTDEDIQYLMSINAGRHSHNRSPWDGSVLKQNKKESIEESDELDTSIDYVSESDELSPDPYSHDSEELLGDDIPDVPDENFEVD